jgi:tetratricopeptide (TPR) repeat protein
MGVPPERIDETLSCLEGNRAASRSPHSPSSTARRRIESIAAQAARMVADFVRSLLLLLTREGEALHERQLADSYWRTLLRRTPAQRLMLVEDAPEYRNWALCERVCLASIEAAPNHPREALALAELAVHIAKLSPGEAATRRNLEGYALAHLSNAWRVCNNLQAMETTLARALKLWEEGDPGLLNPAVVPWIEAAVRKDQRKLKEALRKIDEALRLDSGELRGKILFTKYCILDAAGDLELSTATLYEAAPLIDRKKEPRLALSLEHNLSWDLCRLGRASEAAPRLGKVRQLAEQLGEKLDLTRVVWLGGLVDAGLGRLERAEAAFRQVRRDVEACGLPYDYALVSLDLSDMAKSGLSRRRCL